MTAAIAKSKPGRIPELDWIRGVSALFVMLFHYTVTYGSTVGWPVVIQRGWGAVSAFYLLSGFLTASALKESSKALGYLVKRGRRLYPPYWVCMLMTSALMILFYPPFAPDRDTIVMNLTMLQWLTRTPHVDAAYWTMQYEFRFYLIIAAILLIRQQKHLKWFTILWVLASFVLFELFINQGITRRMVRLPYLWITPENCAPFASGVFLALLKKNHKDIVSWIGLVLALALCVFAQSDGHVIGHLTCAAVVGAAIFLRKSARLSEGYLRVVERLDNGVFRPLKWMAAISFPFYLLHQNIGLAILNKLGAHGLTSEWTILIPIAVVAALSWLVHRFVEVPLSRS